MEEQPSFEPQTSEVKPSRQQRIVSFFKRLVGLLIISFVGSGLYALLFGPVNLSGFSDGLFIFGTILLIIGLLPLASEIFSRSTVTFRSGDRTFKDVLEEQRGRQQRGEAITYLFGVGGIIVIALSFVFGFSVK